MELIYLIGNYLLKFYYFYVMSIKGVVGFFLPDIAVPFVTGFFAILIEISFFMKMIVGATYIQLFLNKGLWLFSVIWGGFFLTFTSNDFNYGFTGEQLSNLKGSTLFAVIIILGVIQLSGQINIIATGVKRGRED